MILFIRTLLAISLAAIVWTALAAIQLVSPPWWTTDWMHFMGFLIASWVLAESHEKAIHRRAEMFSKFWRD